MRFITSSKVRVISNSKQTLGRRGNMLSILLLTIPTCCSLCARPASQLSGSEDQNSPVILDAAPLFFLVPPKNIDPTISERGQCPRHTLLLWRSKEQQKKKSRRTEEASLGSIGSIRRFVLQPANRACLNVCTCVHGLSGLAQLIPP